MANTFGVRAVEALKEQKMLLPHLSKQQEEELERMLDRIVEHIDSRIIAATTAAEARGKQIAFEAACKIACTMCEREIPFAKDGITHQEPTGWSRCDAFRIRRAAQQFGVELDAQKESQ